MTPSELKYEHLQHNPESLYFTRDTMRFFGDKMSNYGVRLAGADKEFYELYRKLPVKNGLKKSAYFCKTTFKRIK